MGETLTEHTVTRDRGASVQARADGFPDGKEDAKWRGQHAALECVGTSSPPQSHCSADHLFLHLPRQRSLWGILTRKHCQADYLAADLSQSVQRAADRTDWTLPTITPRSIIAVSSASRVLAPVEKILLHGFPVHHMRPPQGVTDNDLETMGGNTMHVHIVGAAMLLASGLVNWTKKIVHSACKMPRCVKPSAQSRRPTGQAKHVNKPFEARREAIQLLASRWGILQQKPRRARKGSKAKVRPLQRPLTKRPKLPQRIAALRGTRWG